MTVQFSTNISAAIPGGCMRLLKDLLVTNGWTLMGSSSGSGGSFTQATTIAVGSNGAVLPQATINVVSTTNFPASGTFEVWAGGVRTVVTYTGVTATTFTGCTGGTGTLATGDVVSYDWWTTDAIADTSGSWMRIQMPTANSVLREVLFQRGTNGASSWNIRYSRTAGFITGGSATTVPTATDSQIVLSGAAGGATQFGAATGLTALAMCDDAAPYGFSLVTNSTAASGDGFFMDPMVTGTFDTADVDPYVFGAGSALFTEGAMGTSTAGSNIWGWHKKGLAGEGWVQFGAIGPYCMGGTGSSAFLGTDAYTGYDIALGLNWARIASQSAPTGWKGSSTFLKLCMVNRTKKDTFSTTGANSRDYLVCTTGAIYLTKWNGAVPA